jgi:hypothetical protein
VVSVTDPYNHILGFPDPIQNIYFSMKIKGSKIKGQKKNQVVYFQVNRPILGLQVPQQERRYL